MCRADVDVLSVQRRAQRLINIDCFGVDLGAGITDKRNASNTPVGLALRVDRRQWYECQVRLLCPPSWNGIANWTSLKSNQFWRAPG
jgi:hypothetical protein